ncbi:aminodeoxychorismate/anthranilate synthase component II [Microbacterium kribbense]|uniref:Aminodeoxychorismate/anthranilate synthase component II n=1 Tax=Microbacterium kribbense TaxID=433645 RepID=A0ABP7G2G3_9MICO
MSEILVVDNHDSFVHILVDYLGELGASVHLVEADAIDPDAAAAALGGYAGVLISPGPGTPAQAGASIPVVRAAFERRMPLLGVCLGHQAIAEAFGGTVGQAPELMHGMVSDIHHDGTGLFDGMPAPFPAGRYHSLAVTRMPGALEVTARTDRGVVMALAHPRAPIWGVQFHPESVLTRGGHRLLGNWLTHAGMPGAAERGAHLTVRR